MTTITLEEVRSYSVPANSFAIWWLGQASFLIKSAGGTVLAYDPYLTNSCKALGEQVGINMDRMVPPPLPPEGIAGVDGYVLTHSHQDHLDPETLAGYRAAGGQGPYIAPGETVDMLIDLGVPAEQTVMIWPNKERVIGDITLRATFAIPPGGDDLTHIGYLSRLENGPTLYFTGDTTYHDLIALSVAAHQPQAMFTVINPAFSNLSPEEAARLARKIDPQVVIPCHYNMFPDNCQPPHMLHTNLKIAGIGDRYRELEVGVPYVFPEA